MNELILKFKDEAIKNMIEKDVLASVQLMYLLVNKDSKIEHEVLLKEVTEREDLKGVKNYKEACKIFASSNKEKNKFINIIEYNKLFIYDNEANDNKESVIGDSIEIDIEQESSPAVEAYSVKEKYEDDKSLCNTNDLEYAKSICNEKEGYSVFDSKGRTVYVNTKPIEEEPKEEVVELHKKAVVSGAYFKLKDVNGYNTHVSTESNMKLNGGFYIHDDNVKNGRVKISKSRNDKYLCFVNVEDLNRNK